MTSHNLKAYGKSYFEILRALEPLSFVCLLLLVIVAMISPVYAMGIPYVPPSLTAFINSVIESNCPKYKPKKRHPIPNPSNIISLNSDLMTNHPFY